MRRERARGFTLVAAIFLIVVLAALALTLANIAATSRQVSTLSIMAARARSAAQGGVEWAIWQALNSPATLNCGNPAGTSFVIAGGVLDGFVIRVVCSEQAGIIEGATGPYSVYSLTVDASRGNVGEPDYLHHTILATVSNAQ
ncbi:MAG: hypothetical protein D6786_00020 [Gammaproteobacteria bacterium]|nr:MAG: hypothetical protein D6786_00020 [Gammaproteobacteria bacterium]